MAVITVTLAFGAFIVNLLCNDFMTASLPCANVLYHKLYVSCWAQGFP